MTCAMATTILATSGAQSQDRVSDEYTYAARRILERLAKQLLTRS